MLWDLGSTMSGLTLSFAYVVGIKVTPLAMPITLQLGTIGSCLVVNYNAKVTISVPHKYWDIYMDVANFD